MEDAEAKGEVHASGSEPENKVSEDIVDVETTISEVVKLDVEVSAFVSGGEEMREDNKKGEEFSVKSSNAEPAATELVNIEPAESEQVNMELEVPASVSGPEGKREENKTTDKKEPNNKEKGNSGQSSMKRKGKKLTKPGNKASMKIAATEPVKLNAEVPAAIAGGEEKSKEEKEEETKEKQQTTPGELSKKRKKMTRFVKKASINIAAVETAASEPPKLTAEVSGAIPGGEENSKEDKKEKEDHALLTPGEKSKKRKRKKTVTGSDKPETSTKEKDAKKSASMGMIFMCSSKTKQDCYRYKVFGLPAGKKDVVAKIYKGMRLFLFDIDLKLLYGIYKAAGPGGYNLEPKAFKSAFPSQVRFSVMEDCLPLPEEKFKAVIKDNYYGKNKFNCQLNGIQVKNLCKLFKKGHESKQLGRAHKPEPHSFVDRSRENHPVQDRERRQGKDRERRQGQDREKREGRDRDRRQGRDRVRRQGRDRVRPPTSSRDYRVSQPDGMYEREVFASAMLPTRPPPHLLLPPPYPYERSVDLDSYRRDPVVERHSRQFLDSEVNRREDISYREPLGYSRDPPAREPHLSYHELLYSSRAPPADEPPHPYHERLYTRILPAQEPPLPYHETAYARAAPSYPLSSLYRH